MAVKVGIEWHWIDVHPDDTWSKTSTALKEQGTDLSQIDRAVYVIRSAGSFSIKYPKRHSPVLYIGEGDFKQRITSHRKWLSTLYALVGEFPLEVAVSLPRVPGNFEAYKNFEAYLLNKFLGIYGTLPLVNKQNETIRYEHHEYDRTATADVFGMRRRHYKWAIQPLPGNRPFYGNYSKTHARD